MAESIVFALDLRAFSNLKNICILQKNISIHTFNEEKKRTYCIVFASNPGVVFCYLQLSGVFLRFQSMKQDLNFLEKKAKLTNVSKCFVVFVVIVKLENKHRLTFVDRSFTLCSPACNSLQYDFFRLPCLYIFLIITENHVCGKNNNSQTILLSLQN